ncbi:MAG TPA: paraquat-inducible protein A [Candidatus Bathyarchaeia archaeon]|nr:paraquat-inducible protein A [Candidatus Bathyarchaeia archaeon]
MTAITAARAGFMACHACGLVHRADAHAHGIVCARCGAALHLRKPNSVTRTWALLIAAYVLIIPANILPVMVSGSLFGSESDTIMSGVVFLWRDGSAPLAIILFFASIAVPFSKLFALTYLLLSVKKGSTLAPRRRTQLYRILEFVGRWSMIDIYVASLLTALVQFGGLMSIQAGPGAIAFGAVVVITMFAAESFDPRLIWDPIEERHG